MRFTNAGAAPLDMSGWLVHDEGDKHRHRFAPLVLDARRVGHTVHRVRGPTATERYFCNSGSAVWNNSGDIVHLLDSNGALIAHRSGQRDQT